MKIEAEKYTILLRRPFRIAHGSSDTRDTILVRVESGGLTGHGEGALPPYYPSVAEDCLRWIGELKLPEAPEGLGLAETVASLPPAPEKAAAARVAVEIALCDWWAQGREKPLWKAWGLDASKVPPVARTIPICADEVELTAILKEDSRCEFLKLKLGSGDMAWDEEAIRITRRQFPAAQLCVDVNEGWAVSEAVRLLRRIEDCALAFVEQPVGREIEAWRELRSALGEKYEVPLVADESLQREEDLTALKGLADGVNVKLLKAGGLLPARRWLLRAGELGFRTMVGVMVETGIGRTAAAQLAPLTDWLDIDPPEDIPVAPMCGFTMEEGRLGLPDLPGLGLKPVQ
ncbi:dipeptide epimerase [soil metagenome]